MNIYKSLNMVKRVTRVSKVKHTYFIICSFYFIIQHRNEYEIESKGKHHQIIICTNHSILAKANEHRWNKNTPLNIIKLYFFLPSPNKLDLKNMATKLASMTTNKQHQWNLFEVIFLEFVTLITKLFFFFANLCPALFH